MSREPKALKRGKAFHRQVQGEWEEVYAEREAHDDTEHGTIDIEHTIPLLSGMTRRGRRRRGRMDIFVDGFEEMVTVVEIKATNWDQIPARNRRRNLSSHCRQVWRYIEKHLDGDGLSVCAGIIYPTAPKAPGVREEVEDYLNDFGIQVVWYDE